MYFTITDDFQIPLDECENYAYGYPHRFKALLGFYHPSGWPPFKQEQFIFQGADIISVDDYFNKEIEDSIGHYLRDRWESFIDLQTLLGAVASRRTYDI